MTTRTMIDPAPALPLPREPRPVKPSAAAEFYRRQARLHGTVRASDWPPPREQAYQLTRSEFVVRGNPGMRTDDDTQNARRVDNRRVEPLTPTRYADDDQVEADDDEQSMRRCDSCGRFVRADDDEALDDDTETLCGRCAALDDDEQLSDEDLDDDEAQLYDSDDMWDEPQSAGYAGQSRQPQRSTGCTTSGVAGSRRDNSGAARSAPGMSPGRSGPPDDRYGQMGAGGGPPGRGGMAPVRGSERYMTGIEKRLAAELVDVRRTLREHGSVLGYGLDRHMIEAPAPAVLGEDLVGRARRYAREHRLSWRDPSQRMVAFEAVGGGDPNSLATEVDTGYAISATHSRDLELAEPLLDGEWVDAAKRLAQRRGWNYSDPNVRLKAFQAVAGR